MATMATKTAKTYTNNCTNCGATFEARRPQRAGVRQACSKSECMMAVTAAHNADVAAYDAAMAARRAERKTNPQPRQERIIPASDWNMLVGFMGRKGQR